VKIVYWDGGGKRSSDKHCYPRFKHPIAMNQEGCEGAGQCGVRDEDRQERKEKKKKQGEVDRHRSDCRAVASPGRTKAQRRQGAEHQRPLKHQYIITWCENGVGTERNRNQRKRSMI
jgi:hypothetical protein